MATVTETFEQTAEERPDHSACPHVGYYFWATPRLEDGPFWVGPFPNLFEANDTRRKKYPWPSFDTEAPGYFADGSCLA